MFDKEPNWFAAGAGVAYVLAFLFAPMYTCIGLVPFTGMALLERAPVVVFLLICGLLMIASGLLVEWRISLGLGAGCTLLTLIFALTGTSVVANGLPTKMSYGAVLCIVLCVAYCVLELMMGNVRKKKIQAQLWDSQDGQGGQEFSSVDFF